MTVCYSFELIIYLNGVDKIAQNHLCHQTKLHLQQIKKQTWISWQTHPVIWIVFYLYPCFIVGSLSIFILLKEKVLWLHENRVQFPNQYPVPIMAAISLFSVPIMAIMGVTSKRTLGMLLLMLFCVVSGQVMGDLAYRLLSLSACKFQPKHARNLGNQFACFVNYETELNKWIHRQSWFCVTCFIT